jgi:integrase
VKHLRAAFGLDQALAITPARVETYKATRLAEGHKPATVNRELAALRRMFSLAMRAEMLPHRPHVAMLAEDNVREGFLEPAEFEAVCHAKNAQGEVILPAYLQDALRFAYLTAWRRGAVGSLEWRDVDLHAKTLRLRAANAKNKRGKVIPLRAEVLAILERRAEDRRPDCLYVFHRNGRRLVDYRKAWKAACAAAGLSGIVVHDLRRSAARNAVRSGVPEQVAMELGGWRTRSVFARYNVTSERDLADAPRAD